MSVINKVLRDLDKRQGTTPAAPTAAELGLRSGTASIESQTPVPRVAPATSVRWGALGLPALLLALVGGGVTLWQSGALESLVASAPAKPASVAVVAVAPEAVPATPVASGLIAQQANPTPGESQAPVVPNNDFASVNRFESTLVLPKDMKPVAAPQPVPAAVPSPAKTSTPVAVPLAAKAPPPAPSAAVAAAPVAAPPPPAAVATAPATLPVPSAAELAQKQQQAARDALAQAQSLWNAGSRDAAVDLLQQAVASTERTAQTAPSAGTTQTLVLLVREFGRMQLAEGRPGAVWDALTRMEPLLRNEPEMWALRANAAQRLGRHQDSVHAYMTALQSRPTEQRWLLGTAVSLAALGQTTSAADMAEKARAVGPISREVQTYLRQMGVPLKDL